MKFWAKAIWKHLKVFLGDVALCLLAVVVTLVLGTLAVGAISALCVGFIYAFGIDALGILLIVMLTGMIIWGIGCCLYNTYKNVKATKERMEREANA